MKDFSVVKIGGRQYKVSAGDEINIEKIEGAPQDKISFNEVLLTSHKGTVTIGKPVVDKSSVQAEIMEQAKGKKINILTYKAKSRYRRRKGHRQYYTKIKIVKI